MAAVVIVLVRGGEGEAALVVGGDTALGVAAAVFEAEGRGLTWSTRPG
jgi:hypothetical protein